MSVNDPKNKAVSLFLLLLVLILGAFLTYISTVLKENKKIVTNNGDLLIDFRLETPESEGIAYEPMTEWKSYEISKLTFKLPPSIVLRSDDLRVGIARFSSGKYDLALDLGGYGMGVNCVEKVNDEILKVGNHSLIKTVYRGLSIPNMMCLDPSDDLYDYWLRLNPNESKNQQDVFLFSFSTKNVSVTDADKLFDQILSTFEFVEDITEEEAIQIVKANYPEVNVINKTDGSFNSSSDIKTKKNVTSWKIVFNQGWGDCPSGCINNQYWYFTVDNKKKIIKVGEYKRVFDQKTNSYIELGSPMWDFLIY